MLVVVIGNLEPAAEEVNESNGFNEFLSAVLQGARKGADLKQTAIDFSRQQVVEDAAVDVNEIICGMSGLMRQTMSGQIEIEFLLSDKPCLTEPDPAQRESAVPNLALNARDATPGSGNVTTSPPDTPGQTTK